MKVPHISTDIDFEFKFPGAKVVLLLFPISVILFFVIYPIFLFTDKDSGVKTQTAVCQTVYGGVEAEAFVVRNERYINNPHVGTVVPALMNGRKVSTGDIVAGVYANEAQAQSAARLKELGSEIDYYSDVAAKGAAVSSKTLQSDIALYKSNVADGLLSLSLSIEQNRLSEIYEKSRVLRGAITEKQIAVGNPTDVGKKLESLRFEYDSLKKHSSSPRSVAVEETGYYVSFSDGYEKTLDYAGIKNISCSELKKALAAPPASLPESNMGKVITDFTWYLVCCADTQQLSDIDAGDTVAVIFPESSVDKLSMKVVGINRTDGAEEAVLVLSSNEMDENIAALRFSSVQIRTKEFSGFAVDKQAIRTVDGNKGVYVKLGKVVKFKKIDVIYSDDNIILADSRSKEGGYLRLYDEIITEGTELYEGKILD